MTSYHMIDTCGKEQQSAAIQDVKSIDYEDKDNNTRKTHSAEKSFFLISLEAHQTNSVNLKTIGG